MAYVFGQITGIVNYKGHKIETTESPLQIVYVVDGNRKSAYWSMADAKRAINGVATKYNSTDVNSWFE